MWVWGSLRSSTHLGRETDAGKLEKARPPLPSAIPGASSPLTGPCRDRNTGHKRSWSLLQHLCPPCGGTATGEKGPSWHCPYRPGSRRGGEHPTVPHLPGSRRGNGCPRRGSPLRLGCQATMSQPEKEQRWALKLSGEGNAIPPKPHSKPGSWNSPTQGVEWGGMGWDGEGSTASTRTCLRHSVNNLVLSKKSVAWLFILMFA